MANKKIKQIQYSEFIPPDTSQWVSAVKKTLERSLSASEITPFSRTLVKPLYTEDDSNQIGYLKDVAFKEMLLGKGWELRETIRISTTETESDFRKASHALNQGADGIIYDLRPLDNKELLLSCLQNIQKQGSLSFIPKESQLPALLEFMANHFEKNKRGSLYADSIGNWTTTGFPYDDSIKYLSNALKHNVFQSGFHSMVIDGSLFQEAGGHQVHELAFTLSKTTVYLDELTDQGHDPYHVIGQMEFAFSVGSDFITEIAKIRAFKLLCCQLAKAYGVTKLFPHQILIHGHPARWNQSSTDRHTNLIRNTAETMAALLGGCNFLTVNPDPASAVNESFDRRMLRNISHILEHESYFSKVADPVAGSYFIDHLTNQLMEQAWALFLKLEEKGGFIQGIQSGFIRKEILANKNNLMLQVKEGKKVLIGINKYKPEGEATAAPIVPDKEIKESNDLLLRPFRIEENI